MVSLGHPSAKPCWRAVQSRQIFVTLSYVLDDGLPLTMLTGAEILSAFIFVSDDEWAYV